MPHYLGNILVVTQKELIPRFVSTYQALAKKIARTKDKSYGIKRVVRGGNNHPSLILFDSLPSEWQQELGDPRIPDHILQKYYQIDPDAVVFYDSFQYPDGSYLLDHSKEKYILNASVLTALVKLEAAREAERISKGGSLRGIVSTIYSDAHTFNAHLLKTYKVEHSLNSSLRRFKQQFKEFKINSYQSLIKDAKGASKKNALKIDKATEVLLNNLFAGRSHKPNATEVAREYDGFLAGYAEVVNEKTGEIYNPKSFKKLSIGAITNYLRSYDAYIGNVAKRSGDRQKLMQQTTPYESLEQPFFAGSMISIDDRQPPFWYEKGQRMWWYLGIDLASEAITCWAYGKTKEELILNFYRQMVRNYHKWGVQLPDALECESSLNSSFKNTFLQKGTMFQNVQIHPNSARSKRIERYYGALRYGIEKKREGWIARPFALSEANQSGPKPTPIIPYDKLVKQQFHDIITWNNTANNQDKSISRFDYFLQRQHPDLKPTNWKGFLKHLGYCTETSCHAGLIALQNGEWVLGDNSEIYTGENLIRLLREVEGKSIKIYWLDDEDGNVIKALVYDFNETRLICEALPKPRGAKAPIERQQHHIEAKEIMTRYKNTVTSYMKLRKNAIDKLTVIDNRPTTISNSFSIDGITSFEPRTTPVNTIESPEEDDETLSIPKSTNSAFRDSFFN